jgi:hypothetical protein
MPVSHELKCIFVHIPRTGGTSVESALGLFGDWRDENTNSMFGLITSPDLKSSTRLTKYLQHLTAEELRSLLPDEFEKYYRFAFVRNPWERMVSIWCYNMRAKGVSFEEFLEKTEHSWFGHLTPQHTFVTTANGECLVDFVGRFERLTADFAEICSRLSIERALPHLNAMTHADYRTYYDETSRKIVERRYGDDIERFRYKF